MTTIPTTNLTMLSLVKEDGVLEVSLARLPMAEPKPHEVLVRISATPINPSDLGLLFSAADLNTATASERDGLPVLSAKLPEPALRAKAARIGEAPRIGN